MEKELVYGVGINDANYPVHKCTELPREGGKRKQLKVTCPYYSRWRDMLRRCYSPEYQEKRPTYKDCRVCEEWLTFTYFRAWMETQDWEDKHLDKDLLIPGNKIYSPETCIFIDAKLNYFALECNKSRGSWPIGVHYHKRVKKFSANCRSYFEDKALHLGYYEKPEEAHAAWLAFKLEQAKEIAKTLEDPRLAKALVLRYENYGMEV